jgi:hypothetical protein
LYNEGKSFSTSVLTEEPESDDNDDDDGEENDLETKA